MSSPPQFSELAGEPLPEERLITTSWRTALRLDVAAALDFVPVRTSEGLPRFWPQANRLPEVEALKPVGLRNLHGDEFDRRYFERLDSFGVDEIRAQFAKVRKHPASAGYWHLPLGLLCFEHVEKGESCHRRLFAGWWQRNTGEVVPERDPA